MPPSFCLGCNATSFCLLPNASGHCLGPHLSTSLCLEVAPWSCPYLHWMHGLSSHIALLGLVIPHVLDLLCSSCLPRSTSEYFVEHDRPWCGNRILIEYMPRLPVILFRQLITPPDPLTISNGGAIPPGTGQQAPALRWIWMWEAGKEGSRGEVSAITPHKQKWLSACSSRHMLAEWLLVQKVPQRTKTIDVDFWVLLACWTNGTMWWTPLWWTPFLPQVHYPCCCSFSEIEWEEHIHINQGGPSSVHVGYSLCDSLSGICFAVDSSSKARFPMCFCTVLRERHGSGSSSRSTEKQFRRFLFCCRFLETTVPPLLAPGLRVAAIPFWAYPYLL